MTKHTVRGIIPVETASTRMIEPSKPFVSIRFGNRSTLCICPPQPQSMITAGWTVVKVPGNKWFEWGSHHHRKVSSDSDRERTVWIIMIGYYTRKWAQRIHKSTRSSMWGWSRVHGHHPVVVYGHVVHHHHRATVNSEHPPSIEHASSEWVIQDSKD